MLIMLWRNGNITIVNHVEQLYLQWLVEIVEYNIKRLPRGSDPDVTYLAVILHSVESLGRVSDHYTNERMELCGMMVGALGSAADQLLVTLGPGTCSGLPTSLAPSHIHKARRRADIATFVAEYKKDHLFRYIPGRAHQGFEKFTYQKRVKTPKKMGAP